ncbi:unnamed protein product [Coregonus sp. 'balchen']|nr:unnamed protein product [Coregonus sp. 'balchen']
MLYHNMKHGQIATKELAEFVRERAAIEETYSKSMSKLSKMASNGSPLGTFAPMWDVFRVSSDKLALCHLELMRKMNDLIRDINKYGDEQVKVHRKVQSGHLQKFREGYHAKCIELDRLRKEGAPQKELEKAEMKSKKAAESFAVCIEKYNRVGGDFEQKMSESAQKFQDIEEAHLRQMKQLIKGYSHSIEDTHVQVGQVHEEFKQNVENIGIDNLIQKFAEQKGTGKDRPALVGFEEYMTALVPEGSKKSRGKAFRIPGLGKRDKEPDSTDSAVTETPNSPLEVDEEGFVIRADVNQNDILCSDNDYQTRGYLYCIVSHHFFLTLSARCSTEDKEDNFYSSDSDFDDEEPKKFHVQIRPVGSSSCSNSAATEMELKATVGALTLPPNRGETAVLQYVQRGRERAPPTGRESRTAYADPPPVQITVDAAFSSDSSSPENVEDSGLDSPSHQPLDPSPEPAGWAAWPSAGQNKEPAGLGRPEDPFLTVFRDPSPGRSPHPQDDPASIWAAAPRSPRPPPDMDPSALCFPAFSQSLAPPELEPALWSCKHIPPEDPFLVAFERTVIQETLPPPDAWAPPRPRPSRDGRGIEVQGEPFSGSLSDSKTLPAPSSCSRKDRDRKRDRSAPPPESPDDPFAITMIGSPTHQSALAAATGVLTHIGSSSRLTPNSNSLPLSHPKKELVHWNSVHNPFSEGTSAGSLALGGLVQEGGRKQRESRSESEPRRSGLPLTRHSGPQEDLCFSTDKDQNCLDLNTPQPPCNLGSHKGSKHSFRQDSAELLVAAPPRPARAKRSSGRLSGCERVSVFRKINLTTEALSRSVCSSPQPDPSPDLTSSSSSSPSEWGAQTRAPSPARVHLSRGPSPISLSTQESWPVAAAITEYINAYFKGGQHNRCLVKITGDLTMSFPAGITRIFTANPNAPVLSFRLVNISRSDPDTRDFWFNMQALYLYLQREAELNPQASYYNVALLKYQVSSQDPGRAPLLLSAECQRSGTVTRVSLDYHCCPATAPSTQLTAVQVLLPLDHTATDLQCQPPASWNAEERQLLWKLPNLSPTNHSKGSGTLCASWQCLEVPRGPPPSLAVQFVGSGASLSGMDVELVGSRYRMSLVKKRFATGKYMAGCSL